MLIIMLIAIVYCKVHQPACTRYVNTSHGIIHSNTIVCTTEYVWHYYYKSHPEPPGLPKDFRRLIEQQHNVGIYSTKSTTTRERYLNDIHEYLCKFL